MERIFTKKVVGFIHKILLTQLKNKKKHTASTKTRSKVRGGGRKPWKQKGTGQARAGSSRSPIWVGGGVTFGPIPHIVKKKINKKERHLTILLALALKKKDILIISDNILNLEKPKTKSLVKILESLSILKTEKILLITSTLFENLVYASNNLVNVNLSSPTNLSLQQLLCANKLIFSVSAHNLIKESYEKYYK